VTCRLRHNLTELAESIDNTFSDASFTTHTMDSHNTYVTYDRQTGATL